MLKINHQTITGYPTEEAAQAQIDAILEHNEDDDWSYKVERGLGDKFIIVIYDEDGERVSTL